MAEAREDGAGYKQGPEGHRGDRDRLRGLLVQPRVRAPCVRAREVHVLAAAPTARFGAGESEQPRPRDSGV